MTKQRQSNFELLRIFAMLMIILFHISLHGNIIKYTADVTYDIDNIDNICKDIKFNW